MGKKSKRRRPANGKGREQEKQWQPEPAKNKKLVPVEMIREIINRAFDEGRHIMNGGFQQHVRAHTNDHDHSRALANQLIQKHFEFSSSPLSSSESGKLEASPIKESQIKDFMFLCDLFFEKLRDEVFWNEDDWKFLKKLRKAKKEPAFFRFKALELSGWYCLLVAGQGTKRDGERHDDAFVHFDNASRLLDSLTESGKEIDLELCFPAGNIKVGDYMAERRQKWLMFAHNVAVGSQLLVQGWAPDGPMITTDVPTITGAQCDCCFQSRAELGVCTLNVCSRCDIAYYCSEQCLRKAWTEHGHKKFCRKKASSKKKILPGQSRKSTTGRGR